MVPQSQGLGQLRNGWLKKAPKITLFTSPRFNRRWGAPFGPGCIQVGVLDFFRNFDGVFDFLRRFSVIFGSKSTPKWLNFGRRLDNDLENNPKCIDAFRVAKVYPGAVSAALKRLWDYYDAAKRISDRYCWLAASKLSQKWLN